MKRDIPRMKINLELDPSTQSERNRLAKEARHDYESTYADSAIEDASNTFPKFLMDELTVGKILGKGGFGTVYEVSAFNISADTPTLHLTTAAKKEEEEEEEGDYDRHDVDRLESRQFISKYCLREQTKEVRYAVKVLSPEIAASPEAFPSASYDLAVETRILSSIEHPNIVKLRACSEEGLFHEQYFIVMDRLYDTLEKRLLKWKHRQTRLVGWAGWINHDKNGTQKTDLWQEQIEAAYDLSSALAYLHKQRIVYRDLKPENIGFDIRDDIKLFDFGLATELRESYRDPSSGLFHLTGMTGSPRYMAPEMANSQPYNATCDCYSFAVLLWQILALKVPFGKHLTLAKLHLQVWTYPHERPALVAYEDTWPLDMHCLLKDAWTEEVVKRLSMDEISEILRDQVLKGRSGDGSKLEHSRRRSTHVFRPTSSAKARPFRRSSSDTNSSAFLAAMYGMGKANNNNNNNNKAQDSNDDDLSFSSQERIQIVSWAAPSD